LLEECITSIIRVTITIHELRTTLAVTTYIVFLHRVLQLLVTANVAPDYGGDMFLWNFSSYNSLTVLHPRIWHCSQSPLWKQGILQVFHEFSIKIILFIESNRLPYTYTQNVNPTCQIQRIIIYTWMSSSLTDIHIQYVYNIIPYLWNA
jgi:hypothetical protein